MCRLRFALQATHLTHATTYGGTPVLCAPVCYRTTHCPTSSTEQPNTCMSNLTQHSRVAQNQLCNTSCTLSSPQVPTSVVPHTPSPPACGWGCAARPPQGRAMPPFVIAHPRCLGALLHNLASHARRNDTWRRFASRRRATPWASSGYHTGLRCVARPDGKVCARESRLDSHRHQGAASSPTRGRVATPIAPVREEPRHASFGFWTDAPFV